jgi:pimeloyl-ACP methyl ester carboxylesterase
VPYVGGYPRLWYERSGSGEPVLLITGFTISSAVFEPVLHLYEPELECIRYDNRGSGRSATPPWPTSMPELAGDAVRVLDEAGLESAHVYGVSMGGMIAQELAIRFPERVRGLVLAGTWAGGPRAVRPAGGELAAALGGIVKALRKPGRPWLGELIFSKEFRESEPERARELIAFFRKHRPPPHGVISHLWASIYHDTVSRLGNVQAPTLVMHGEHDAMTPLANAQELARRIPDAELAIVRGAGHAFPLERPEQSFEITMDWLRSREPIAAGRANSGLVAQAEPVTRALGLPIGALRTGASLVAFGAEKIKGGRDVAADRRAA